MTQSEKLEALLNRAVSNGWKVEGEFKHIRKTLDDELIVTFTYKHRDFIHSAASIIIDHEFAKALFGNEMYWTAHPGKSGYKRNEFEIPAYKMHLQQAVIAPDPIDYMYKEVFGK